MNTDRLRPITAIKLFRAATGEGLYEAKQWVETLGPLRAGVDASALGKLINERHKNRIHEMHLQAQAAAAQRDCLEGY